MRQNIDTSWEQAKAGIRAELERLRNENAHLRSALELAQKELRDAAREGGILGLCSHCGHREAV